MVKVRQRKPAYRILFVDSEPGAFFFFCTRQTKSHSGLLEVKPKWGEKKSGSGNAVVGIRGWDSSLLKKQHVATERLLQEPGNKQDDLI